MDERLFRLAAAVRAYLEPVWDGWRGGAGAGVLSANTCGRSSLFLRDALRLEGHAAEWSNGVPGAEGQFGFLGLGGWASHAWVVSGGLIVDVTADQFGAVPVIVTSIDDPRYRASNIDTAWPEAVRARHAAVAAIWPGWLLRRAGLGIDA